MVLIHPAVLALTLAMISGCIANTSEAPVDMAPVPTEPEDTPAEINAETMSTTQAPKPEPADPASQHEVLQWLLPLGGHGLLDGGSCYGSATALPELPEGEGLWYASFQVDPATLGLSFEAKFTSHNATNSLGYVSWSGVIAFLDATDEPLEFGTISVQSPNVNGTVPVGSHRALFWSCESGPMAASYVAGGPMPAES